MVERVIPSRLSIDDLLTKEDLAFSSCLVVRLDGVEQQQVVAYDIEAGTVLRNKLALNGNVFKEGDEIARETVTGVVTVEFEEVA